MQPFEKGECDRRSFLLESSQFQAIISMYVLVGTINTVTQLRCIDSSKQWPAEYVLQKIDRFLSLDLHTKM